jgi:hypothetical protein
MLLAFSIAAAPYTQAFQEVVSPQHANSKLPHPFLAVDLDVQPELEAAITLSATNAQRAGVSNFLSRNPGTWEMRWDRRANRPNLIQGSGIPLIPGRGNSLSLRDLGLASGAEMDMDVVEKRLLEFIHANSDVMPNDGLEFRLDPSGSVPYGEGHSHWFVEFAQYHDGVRVQGASLFFRISNGNIVQFGSNLVAPVKSDATPSSTRANAFSLAFDELNFPAGTVVEEMINFGELLVFPVAPSGADAHQNYLGAAGAGYDHRLAWRFVFRINDDVNTYDVLFDAHSNRIITVRSLNEYVAATVSGGVYPTTNSDAEVVKPLPFASITNGSLKVTDALGIYDYSGGNSTIALDGAFFKMVDNCGAISLANSANGNIAMGTSPGSDCTTPGFGGPGNTHSSRSGFYHLTNINRKAIGFLPTNTWLQGKVTANMNIDDVCNAFWNGTTLNFFKSGGGCSNTGEIAAVFLHEWGHGMDTNSGGAAVNDNGSGEAVGDTFAFLETKDACIGKNFRPGEPCYNCSATCTGVRDLNAFSTLGGSGIAKPSTIVSDGGPECGRGDCPYINSGGFAYQGPMGYEGHCESYIASSANWDLSQKLVAAHGSEGWREMDKIWYGGLTSSKSAYRVASGGQCNPSAQVDGCGSNNWYTVYLAADDDDGNLANGTPNACRIWDAFNAHGIACGARPACSAGGGDFLFKNGFDPTETGSCTPQQLFADPGLEATNPVTFDNPFWVGFDSNLVTPYCNASCDVNGEIAPHTGTWFAWFGGQEESNSSLLAQEVTLPSGSPRWLNYWLMRQLSGDPSSSLVIKIDDTVVATIPAESAGPESAYSARTLQVPAQYLNDQPHTVEFEWEADAAGGVIGGAMLDDITLDCQSHPLNPVQNRGNVKVGARTH